MPAFAGTSSMAIRLAQAAARAGLAAFEDVTAALFPGACRRCGVELPETGATPFRLRPYAALQDGTLRRSLVGPVSLPLWFLCRACAATLDRSRRPAKLAPAGISCVTAFEPTPALFDLVHAFKYEGFRELAPWLGRFLARAARRSLGHDLVLVPIPLHPTRQRERGFNQSALLAREVAVRLGGSVSPVLARRRPTAPQARLAPADRANNVAGAFLRSSPHPAGHGALVLVDDVVTTGATASAALAALAPSGRPVAVLALCAAVEAQHPLTEAPSPSPADTATPAGTKDSGAPVGLFGDGRL